MSIFKKQEKEEIKTIEVNGIQAIKILIEHLNDIIKLCNDDFTIKVTDDECSDATIIQAILEKLIELKEIKTKG